ncbi:MAG: CBS domain-containing protein, partial [Chitinophagaceae bacterium]
LLGIITDGDLRRMLEKTNDISHITAKDILTPNPKAIQPETMAVDALEIFALYDISQLIVVDGLKYVGILHLHDLIKEGIM